MCDITPDVRATFTKSLQSPGLARDFVHDKVCAEHGSRGAVALELLASELVTNAVLYGEAPISLRVSCSVWSMRLEVNHENREEEPNDGFPADGLGFLLVDKVAHEWGIAPTPTGTRVWCTLRTGVVPGRRTVGLDPEAAVGGRRTAALHGGGVRSTSTPH